MGILDYFKKNKVAAGVKPVVLLILDGFGLAPDSKGNAISVAKTPTIDSFYKNYPSGELIASGESVGLPANEVGNTEVGHLVLGAGRVIYQDLRRINESIADDSFFEKKAFLQVHEHLKKNNSNLHLVGLVSSGSVHSSLIHFYAMLKFCEMKGIKNVFLHLVTDGRDADPKEGIEVVTKMQKYIDSTTVGKVATIGGRYYYMDRDARWERTEKAYKTMVLGKGNRAESAIEAVKASYGKNITDEFIEPTVIVNQGKPVGLVNDNDAIIFTNFRIDRPKQLTMAFVVPGFEQLDPKIFGYSTEVKKAKEELGSAKTFNRVKVLQNLFFVTMTEYQKNLPVSAIVFGSEPIIKPLAEIIAGANFKQLHMAESEKERFVTHYFNGMRDTSFNGEDVVIIPSPKIPTYDKKPEMSVKELVKEFSRQIDKNIYKFIVMNFANCDMVAHTGNLTATIKAVEHVDKAIAKVADKILAVGGSLIITADHGNAEELLGFSSKTFFVTSAPGDMNTDHTGNPVPVFIISNELKGKGKLPKGELSDIAPSVLGLLNLKTPVEMTGKDLLNPNKQKEVNDVNVPLTIGDGPVL